MTPCLLVNKTLCNAPLAFLPKRKQMKMHFDFFFFWSSSRLTFERNISRSVNGGGKRRELVNSHGNNIAISFPTLIPADLITRTSCTCGRCQDTHSSRNYEKDYDVATTCSFPVLSIYILFTRFLRLADFSGVCILMHTPEKSVLKTFPGDKNDLHCSNNTVENK